MTYVYFCYALIEMDLFNDFNVYLFVNRFKFSIYL